MKNKYLKRAHINEIKFRELLKFFAEDFTVTQIAKLIACTDLITSEQNEVVFS